MEMKLPDELKDKLNLVEKETDFFSQEPQRPLRFSAVCWGAASIALLGVLKAFMDKDYLFMLLFLLFAAHQITTYLHERRLFGMYSSACEIINFYKKNDPSKT